MQASPSPTKQNRNAFLDQSGVKPFTSPPSKFSQNIYNDHNSSSLMNADATPGGTIFSPSSNGKSSIRDGINGGPGVTTPNFGARGSVLTPAPSTGKKNRRQLVSLMDDDLDGPGSSDALLRRNMGVSDDTNLALSTTEGFGGSGGDWGLRNRYSGARSHQSTFGGIDASDHNRLVDTGDTMIHQNTSWVLVYGFSATNSDESILRKFQQIGPIRDYIPSEKTRGNWMLIKYETPWEARRAITEMNCTNVAMDSLSSMVIGVVEVDANIAAKYNFQLNMDGTVTINSIMTNQPRGITPRRPSQAAQSHGAYRHHRQVEMKDIYRPPRKRPSICARILEFFAFD